MYEILFKNDMGHLVVENADIMPYNIIKFAYDFIKNKIYIATDNTGYGCRFYILRDGSNNNFNLTLGEYFFNINLKKLDQFDPCSMIKL